MNAKLSTIMKETDQKVVALQNCQFVVADNAARFEIALTLGGMQICDLGITLHPHGSAREYLSLFEDCIFTRHSNGGECYHWQTEFCGSPLLVFANEVMASANGTVVMP